MPITSKPPTKGVPAYELPALEVQRLERGAKGRLWVVLNEVNIDRVRGSYYVAPDCKRGQLSRAVYRAVYEAFLKDLPRITRIHRTD